MAEDVSIPQARGQLAPGKNPTQAKGRLEWATRPQAPHGFVPIRFIVNPFTNDYFKNFNGPFTDPDNDVIDND